MCERGYLIRSKCLQDIFALVKKEGTFKAINWNKYPTVPVDDKEKQGMVKIRGAVPIWSHLRNAQCTGNRQSAHCDILLYGKGGFVACHSVIISHFSPVLKELIDENIALVGIPNSTTPISIFLLEFKLEDLSTALGYLYTGFASFPNNRTSSVLALLDFLKIDKRARQNVTALPAGAKMGRELVQHRESCKTDDEDDSGSDSSDDDDTPPKHSGKNARTGDWVKQVNSVKSNTSNQGTNKRPSSGEIETKKAKLSNDATARTGSVASATSKVAEDNSSVASSVTGRSMVSDVGRSTPKKSSTSGGKGGPPSQSTNTSVNKANDTVVPPIGPINQSSGSQGPPPLKQGEFKKVPPGSLIVKHPQPRIIRPVPKSTRDSRKTNGKPPTASSNQGVSPAATKSSVEPVAHCSKATVAKVGNAKNGYDRDVDYRPNHAVHPSFASENDEESEESDPEGGDPLHFVERKLRPGPRGARTSQTTIDVVDEPEGLTLAERVKFNNERKRRSKSGEGNGQEATTRRYPGLRQRRKPLQQSNPDQHGDTNSDSKMSGSSGESDESDPEGEFDASKYLVNSTSSRKRDRECYFCKTVFDTEPELATHSFQECGKHLKNQYTYPEKICRICGKDFGCLTHYGLIRHVQLCFGTGKIVPPPPFVPGRHRQPEPEVQGTLDTLNDPFLALAGGEDTTSSTALQATTTGTQGNVTTTNKNKDQQNQTKPNDENEIRTKEPENQKKDGNPLQTNLGTCSSNDNGVKDATPNAGEHSDGPNKTSKRNQPDKVQTKAAKNLKPSNPESKTSNVSSDEIIPVGNAKVVMEKLSNDLIEQLKISIQNGENPSIPRLIGYNYVRSFITPKAEIPDPYPDDTPEQTAARILELDNEIILYNLESEERRRLRMTTDKNQKQQQTVDVRRVPPLVLRVVNKPALSPEDIYNGFTHCSCGAYHSKVVKTLMCLAKRKLAKCWICCIEVARGNPIENHLRLSHFNARKHESGTAICPVCKLAVPYSNFDKHCFELHFKLKTLLDSSVLAASGQGNTEVPPSHAVEGGSLRDDILPQSDSPPSGEVITEGSHVYGESSNTGGQNESEPNTSATGPIPLNNLLESMIGQSLVEPNSLPVLPQHEPNDASASLGNEVVQTINVVYDPVQISSSSPAVSDPPTTVVGGATQAPPASCGVIISPTELQKTNQVVASMTGRADATLTLSQNPSAPTTSAAIVTNAELNGTMMMVEVEGLTVAHSRPDGAAACNVVPTSTNRRGSTASNSTNINPNPIDILCPRDQFHGTSSALTITPTNCILTNAPRTSSATPFRGYSTSTPPATITLVPQASTIRFHHPQTVPALRSISNQNVISMCPDPINRSSLSLSPNLTITSSSSPLGGRSVPATITRVTPPTTITSQQIAPTRVISIRNVASTVPEIINPPFLSPTFAIAGMYEPNVSTAWTGGNISTPSGNNNTPAPFTNSNVTTPVLEYRPGDIQIGFANRNRNLGSTSRRTNPTTIAAQIRRIPRPPIPNPLVGQAQQQTRLNFSPTRPQPPSYNQSTHSQNQLQHGYANTPGHNNHNNVVGVLRHHVQQHQQIQAQHQFVNSQPQIQHQISLPQNIIIRPGQARLPNQQIQLPHQMPHGQLQQQYSRQLQQQQPQQMTATAPVLMSSQHRQTQNQSQSLTYSLVQSQQPSFPGLVTVESQSSELLQNLFGQGNTHFSGNLQSQNMGQVIPSPQPIRRQQQQQTLHSQHPGNVIHQHNNVQIHIQSNTSNALNVGGHPPDAPHPDNIFANQGPTFTRIPATNRMTSQLQEVSAGIQIPVPSSSSLHEPQVSNSSSLPTPPLPPTPLATVHSCPTCQRLFKSEVLFDTHFCSS